MSDNELHEMKILTGRKLSGRYVLSSLISLGQFTQIWEATDLVLSRTVAVKLTNQHLVSESIFLSKFRAEARTISRLNHPSIVSILDTTGDDQIEAIVMELIEGETLKDAVPEEVLFPGFSILNFTVCTSPGFKSIVFFSG